MPDAASPSMPTVSAPTIGGDFYHPGYTGATVKKTTAASSTAKSAETAGNSAGATAVIKEPGTTDYTAEKIAELAGNTSSALTASDISSLGSSGIFSSIYGLLGKTNTDSLQTTSSNTDAMLSKILTQLNTLKTEQNSKTSAKSEDASPSAPVQPSVQQPSILRFRINGYDVLDTCRTVYFSDRESDGTFLLTGDRKYVSDGKTRTETFYLLFKAAGSNGVSTEYKVQPAVVQDYQNDYSFLYQLAKKKNLTASKTGNLVSMRVTEPSWNLDLLLDAGNRTAYTK